MTFPALLPPIDPFRTQFQRPDIDQPETRFAEPGSWFNSRRHDLQSGCWPAQISVIDGLFAGTNAGILTVTVTPVTSHSSVGAAAGMGPAAISITVTGGQTPTDQVLAVIAEVTNASSLTALADVATWSRFRSYVAASVSPTGATSLRLTSVGPSQEFSVTFTGTAIDAGNTVSQTVIASPSDSTLKVGTYCAIDRTKGINGRQVNGDPFFKVIEASTPAADIEGPIFYGANTQPVTAGFSWREYAQGTDLSVAKYGEMQGLAEKIIPGASVGTPVYVRHTLAVDNIPGLPTDAAGAAADATPNVWTGTPTPANDTWYQVTVTFGEVIETLKYLSDVAATDVEINDGLRADLLTYPNLSEIVGTGTTTLILTGPADGRGFTPVDLGPGVMALVETTPGVSTHTLLTRGDKWVAANVRIGSAPISIPHSNA